MKLSTLYALPLSAVLLSAGGWARADWAQSADPVVVAAAPKNLQIQAQNPPTFTWARYPTATPGYTVEVRQNGVTVQTYSSTRNWVLPTRALAAGSYTWRVTPTSKVDWSTERAFVIDSTAALFEVPDETTLRASIVARPHPRGLQSGLPLFANWGDSIKAERSGALSKLSAEVTWAFTALPGVSDALWPLDTSSATLTAAGAQQVGAVRSAIFANGRQLEASALLYRLTGDQRFLTEALNRGDQLAALSPTGPTSYTQQDQGCRVIALSLIRAVDTLGSAVSGTRRTAWLNAVEVRTNEIYADLSGSNGRMDQYPFDSHGGSNLGYLALIAALSLGDVPSADKWFSFAFRSYASSFSAWSGPEGGFANGTAYAQYTADIALQIWQPLVLATNIDMFNKPWSAGFLRYLTHFVPPGAKRHVFGDENEVTPSLAVMKAYAAHYSTPTAAWYYTQLTKQGVEIDALTLLQAPYPLPVNKAVSVAPPPNSAIYPSIGWVAMHSNIGDPNRTSLYFKSSQYGSYNHSHAEQNSIVLHSGGVPLLPQSGYSDFYGSPLWSSWYRQTKAHNAITFDNGVGQAADGYTAAGYTKTMTYTGTVTAFSNTGTVDIVEGDATSSYAGALTSATRKVWYLRSQDAVVVLDRLSAPVAHSFEWNFHALAPITTDAGGNASFTYQGKSLCIRPLNIAGISLVKRTGPPPKTGVEDHAAFVTAPVTSAEFLTLLDVGCKKPPTVLQSGASGRTLSVGAEVIVLPN